MPEENGDNKDDKIDLGQLTEALKGLPEGVQKAVKDAIHEVSGEQREAAAADAARKAAAKVDEDDDQTEDVDLESLSRNELVNHLEKGFGKTGTTGRTSTATGCCAIFCRMCATGTTRCPARRAVISWAYRWEATAPCASSSSSPGYSRRSQRSAPRCSIPL